MITIKRGTIVILVLASIFLSGCYVQTGEQRGGVAGAQLGGLAGALLDRNNPWRGGIIGAALGAFFGATLGDISDRGAYESVRNNAPVEYHTKDGRGLYRADPEDYDSRTRCYRVRERVYEDGRLIRDHVKEVCERDIPARGY
jgi:hypothetical protein